MGSGSLIEQEIKSHFEKSINYRSKVILKIRGKPIEYNNLKIQPKIIPNKNSQRIPSSKKENPNKIFIIFLKHQKIFMKNYTNTITNHIKRVQVKRKTQRIFTSFYVVELFFGCLCQKSIIARETKGQ